MIRGILLDLDGTVYRGDQEIPGASAFCREMSEAGVRCLFVTNRSNRTPGVVRDQLHEYGIDCEETDVLTTAQATARYVGSGSAYVIGEEGLYLAMEQQGITITEDNPDVVVVGFDREFNCRKLETAATAVMAGKPFIATNPDRRLTLPDRVIPGTGAILAAITKMTDVEPVVIGKPEPLLFDLAIELIGMDKQEVIGVGDSLETDIRAGARAGIRTALMLSGNATRDDVPGAETQPTWVFDSFDELAQLVTDENVLAGAGA